MENCLSRNTKRFVTVMHFKLLSVNTSNNMCIFLLFEHVDLFFMQTALVYLFLQYIMFNIQSFLSCGKVFGNSSSSLQAQKEKPATPSSSAILQKEMAHVKGTGRGGKGSFVQTENT